jgi:hypothetical protein
MRTNGQVMRIALAVATLVATASVARAGGTDGLVLRAAGFFEAEASSGGGSCTIPGIDSGIPVSSDENSLNNLYQYPLSACQGWMQLVNVMTAQGVSIEQVDLRLRIAGAGRFRQFVPTRKGFPTACLSLRKSKIFTGAHLFPYKAEDGFGNTGSGAAHVAFVNLFPMVNAQVMSCLREQYAGLPPDAFVSLPLIIRARATGITDSGDQVRSNAISFTLTLSHLCGNGRVDFNALETCDPNAPDTCAVGSCNTTNFTCSQDASVTCVTDADCAGTCVPAGDPMECTCVY